MISLNLNNPNHLLSKRELQVIELIAYEYSSKEIASHLFIRCKTVKSHRKKIISKLKVKNVAGVVRVAIQNGILL